MECLEPSPALPFLLVLPVRSHSSEEVGMFLLATTGHRALGAVGDHHSSVVFGDPSQGLNCVGTGGTEDSYVCRL